MKKKLSSFATISAMGLVLVFCTNVQAIDKIDPNSADGIVQVSRKVQCSLNDSEPQVYSWRGGVYSRVPGEKDINVFNLYGMNVRQCVTVKDEKRGTGYRMVSREIMLYLDPKTNEVLRKFKNPWSGAINDVFHVANDPVNNPAFFGRDAEGKTADNPLKEINGTWYISNVVRLFYTNPLAGDYQQYVGGTYHVTELFNFSGEMVDLLDSKKPVAYPTIAWVRISPWLPWMEMGNRAGMLYFNAVSKKLKNFDQLADVMKAEIAANYPEYVAPPPIDDARPNETSWTYMKKIIDGRRKNETKPRH